MAAHVVLPWIDRVFALMKRWGLGTYHGLRRKHVDTYLNEFVFRYNRRFYRHVSFETMLGFAAHHEPASYWDVIGRANPRKGNVTLRRVPPASKNSYRNAPRRLGQGPNPAPKPRFKPRGGARCGPTWDNAISLGPESPTT